MIDPDIQNLTLREKFTGAERLTRELIEHLDQGFQTRTNSLRRLIKHREGASDDDVPDKSVRNHVRQVFESDKYTQELHSRLMQHLKCIEADMKPVIYGKN